MEATVLIPWLNQNDPWRTLSLTHTTNWWKTNHPDYQLIIGESPQPWRKGLAIHNALKKADGDIIIMSDADVLCDPQNPQNIETAISQIINGNTNWAVPHQIVYRLSGDATIMLTQHNRYPQTPWKPGIRNHAFTEIYRGVAGGGMVILTRDLIKNIPIDPRFIGWGQEDYAWQRALTMLAGHPWRGRLPLLHLWHKPQERLTRGVGSRASVMLWRRYLDAGTVDMMKSIIGEVHRELACAE